MTTFQDKLNEIVPAVEAFGKALEAQWAQTNLKEFFTVKKLFAQYSNVYQLIIEGILLVVSAAVAIALIEAVASVLTGLALLATVVCAVMAGYQAFVNNNSKDATNLALYAASALAISSLTAIIAPLLWVGTIGLVGYKSSDLIKAALPDSVKTNTFDMAKNSWTWFNRQVDNVQETVTNYFNP
jgi:hypothetical protein